MRIQYNQSISQNLVTYTNGPYTTSGLRRHPAADFTFPPFYPFSNADNSTLVTDRRKMSVYRHQEIEVEESVGDVISGLRRP